MQFRVKLLLPTCLVFGVFLIFLFVLYVGSTVWNPRVGSLTELGSFLSALLRIWRCWLFVVLSVIVLVVVLFVIHRLSGFGCFVTNKSGLVAMMSVFWCFWIFQEISCMWFLGVPNHLVPVARMSVFSVKSATLFLWSFGIPNHLYWCRGCLFGDLFGHFQRYSNLWSLGLPSHLVQMARVSVFGHSGLGTITDGENVYVSRYFANFLRFSF